MPRPVQTVARIDGLSVHRFQVVREHRERTDEDGPDDDGRAEWIVVGFGDEAGDDDDGGEVTFVLADRDFQWTRRVSRAAFESGRFEPLSAGDVPVWGY